VNEYCRGTCEGKKLEEVALKWPLNLKILEIGGNMKREIIYFDEPGPQNTDAILEVVKNRLIPPLSSL